MGAVSRSGYWGTNPLTMGVLDKAPGLDVQRGTGAWQTGCQPLEYCTGLDKEHISDDSEGPEALPWCCLCKAPTLASSPTHA